MTDDLIFKSQFSETLKSFILEKRGLGYKYHVEAATLCCFIWFIRPIFLFTFLFL